MRKKKEKIQKKDFIVLNSNAEYFCGLMYGGQIVWTNDYKEAKPLDHINKFKTLERISGESLYLEYIKL